MAVENRRNRKFSTELETWLESPGKKTLGDLLRAFDEKSFAILFLLLMAIPALPIPTGGVTHVFEVIAMLLALEMIIGRSSPWLPKRFLKRELGATTQKKVVPFVMRRVRWFDSRFRRRLPGVVENRITRSVLGVLILGYTVTAFLAPPFSGLDTIPSVGVVIISLGLILEDTLLAVIGTIVGAIGVALVVVIGSAAAHFLF